MIRIVNLLFVRLNCTVQFLSLFKKLTSEDKRQILHDNGTKLKMYKEPGKYLKYQFFQYYLYIINRMNYCLLFIIQHLEIKDIISCSLVCKIFREILEDPKIWNILIGRDFMDYITFGDKELYQILFKYKNDPARRKIELINKRRYNDMKSNKLSNLLTFLLGICWLGYMYYTET